MNGILTVKQVATKLQLNKETIYRWLRNGRLAGYRINKLWRVSEEDLASFLERRVGADQNTGERIISSPEQVADSAPGPSIK